MAGPVPAIHVFDVDIDKTWMPGARPGMTNEGFCGQQDKGWSLG
jgi:hypothetical protein